MLSVSGHHSSLRPRGEGAERVDVRLREDGAVHCAGLHLNSQLLTWIEAGFGASERSLSGILSKQLKVSFPS
jgi:hypothetical protein